MTPEKLAYLAGALDHIGTIRIGKSGGRGRYTRPVVSITTHSRESVQAFVDVFGGSISVGASLKNSLRWQRTDSSAVLIMRTLRPFMGARAKQVDEILAWVDERMGTRDQRTKENQAKATAMAKEAAQARAKIKAAQEKSKADGQQGWGQLLSGQAAPSITAGARRVVLG